MNRPYIYVASSWRNEVRQQKVVRALRDWGADVYDFRHPANGSDGFHWSAIDPDYKQWTASEFTQALEHPIARRGFRVDMAALQAADIVVLVAPCGSSAHLELGHAVGAHKPTAILLEEHSRPELMYSMVDLLTVSVPMLCVWAKDAWESMGLDVPEVPEALR